MGGFRKRDFTKRHLLSKEKICQVLMALVLHRYGTGNKELVTYTAKNLKYHMNNVKYRETMMAEIRIICFETKFQGYSDDFVFNNFCFTKAQLYSLANTISFPITRTKRKRYRTSSILFTAVVLRRMASPCRWDDLNLLFGKHASQLSEIFWESIAYFVGKFRYLLQSPINSSFIQERGRLYSYAVHRKTRASEKCVGLIDGTVIAIARPDNSVLQNVAYNGHKRKHALKFQTVTTPDGFLMDLILHAHGPTE